MVGLQAGDCMEKAQEVGRVEREDMARVTNTRSQRATDVLSNSGVDPTQEARGALRVMDGEGRESDLVS